MDMVSSCLRYEDLLENVVCNICGCDDHTVIYPPHYELACHGGEVTAEALNSTFRSSGDEILVDRLVRCRRCGLQYLTPRLKDDVVLNAYREGSDETFISQAAAREETFARSFKLIERHAASPGKLLDIGTAGGSFLKVAQKRGWQVAGCEPNEWLARWGERHYGIPVFAGTVFEMKLPDTSFDVVTLWDVLEHTPDPKKILLECSRVLKPGGILVVNYPDIGSAVARVMGRRWVFLLSVHLYYFTRATIARLLSETGFNVIRQQKHWQSLELDYILFRMKPYIPRASDAGRAIVKTLGLQKSRLPYWMGQSLVLAAR
jgi:2-polyprenyl-3-methyl-5-hydroxy-6-metoxy-1,4-benzoquinol methylase